MEGEYRKRVNKRKGQLKSKAQRVKEVSAHSFFLFYVVKRVGVTDVGGCTRLPFLPKVKKYLTFF